MSSTNEDITLTDYQKPIVFVLSDARGETANTVVMAAAAQFGPGCVEIRRFSGLNDVETLKNYLDEYYEEGRPCAVFHTFAHTSLRRNVRRELDRRGIPSIDLLGPAITILSALTNNEPINEAGLTFEYIPKEDI